MVDASERLARFAPVTLTADPNRLSARQQTLVHRLIAAGRQINEIYLHQVWAGNAALREQLAADDASPDLRRLFELMGGPWDHMDEDKPFVGDQLRPAGANFYPEDLGPEEFAAWLEEHPHDRPALTSYFTLIRRHGAGLKAVPYCQEYRQWLEPAAEALSDAARLAEHTPLAEYLSLRAQALLDDNYFESDCAWVALQDGPIETVIGPYEVYDDRLFGYKAAYECMVGLRDMEEGARFHGLIGMVPLMTEHLPGPPEYRGETRDLASPIVVADTVFNGGQQATAAIPIAFVLPNDPRVRTTVGSKKVMLKNVSHAKFDHILWPIAQDALDPAQTAAVSFDVYFGHILLHEISHVMGARQVSRPDGTEEAVHQALRDLYSPIEECKADIVGLYNVLFLAQEGIWPREWGEQALSTYLAGILRQVRMGGTQGAHSRGSLIAFNFLREQGGLRVDRKTGRLRAELRTMVQGVTELAAILLRIEGRGDYQGARALSNRYVHISPEMENALGQVRRSLPVDLAPTYPWADR